MMGRGGPGPGLLKGADGLAGGVGAGQMSVSAQRRLPLPLLRDFPEK